MSKYKDKRPGMYDVQFTTRDSDHRISVSGFFIDHAESPKDAYDQANKKLSPALVIVKVVIIFLGIAWLISQFLH